ncbi:hypothetical protein GCM10017687_69830 [Streptomyces echinatus]
MGGGGPGCLSEWERQVLASVTRVLSPTRRAPASLGLSPLTVKTRVGRVMGKLGARDRAHLVIVAYGAGDAGRPSGAVRVRARPLPGRQEAGDRCGRRRRLPLAR